MSSEIQIDPSQLKEESEEISSMTESSGDKEQTEEQESIVIVNEEPVITVTVETTDQKEVPTPQQSPQEASFEVVPPLVDLTPDGLIVHSKEKLRKELKGDEDLYDSESASMDGLIVRSKERLRKDLKGEEDIYDAKAASADLVSKSKYKLREELEAAKKRKREEKQESEVTTSLTRSFETKGHGK